jgi:ParB family chromosome partitioning protein
MKLNFQEVPIETIKPYWRNPRNSAAAIPGVRASIERYGYQVPILVDRELVIIAGHARYAALNQLGRTSVWVIVADLPPKKVTALRIADNKAHEWSTWDPEKLLLEVRELGDLTAVRQLFRGEAWQEIFGTDLEAPKPEPAGPLTSSYSHKSPICPYCGTVQ